jgi:hypothetical protein
MERERGEMERERGEMERERERERERRLHIALDSGGIQGHGHFAMAGFLDLGSSQATPGGDGHTDISSRLSSGPGGLLSALSLALGQEEPMVATLASVPPA